jgi:hypothetical protein
MENPQANPQAGQDGQMQQVMQMVQQMLQQGAQPVEVAQQLLQEQMPPEAIMEVFTQMGMQPEEAQATIQEAMQGGQQQPQGPGEEQMEGQASNPQEGAPQGGQPSPEEMAMMQQQQQGAPPMPGMAQGGAPDLQAQADQVTAQVQKMIQQGATAEQVQQELMAAIKNGEIDEQVGSYVLQQLGGQQQAPVARFGGNARALIRKALGGDMPEVDSTSNSYVQDRQAAFVKSVKKNALLHDFDNEFPSLKGSSAPKFNLGGVPKQGDYKTANEYKLALYEYNASKTDAKDQVDIKDLSSKWTEPIAEGASGKWVGGKFVPDASSVAPGSTPSGIRAESPAPGYTWDEWAKLSPETKNAIGRTIQAQGPPGQTNQYFNNTPEQQNLAKLQASPFGKLMSNSGWDHGDMNWNSSGLTNDPNAKFKVTHVEGKKGLFGRRKVAFDLDWSTAASAPGTIPPAPGTAINTQDIVEKKVGDQTLKFDKMGNQLQASKYNPNNFITAEQAVKEDENYVDYSEAVASKQYDPMTGKFADVQTDRPVNTSSWNNGTIYTQANPLPADDVKALQATMGLPETGVWDDAFTKSINEYKTKTFGKNANLNGSIGAETGDKLLADYVGRNFDDKTRIDKITTANPNAGMAGDYQNYTQFDANKNIKTATEAAEKAAKDKLLAERKGVLDKADEVYNQRGRVYKAFHDSPTENANEYQAKLDEVKAEEERQKALDAANPYTGQQRAFGGPSNDVVQSAMHILKMALGGMTYQNNYDFLPKAIDGGFGFKPIDDSELENMNFGVPVDETIKTKTEAEKLAEYQKGYNERLAVVDPKVAGEPIDLGKSGKGKITGKSKLKVSWGDAFEAANNGMERFGKWSDQMYRNTEDKNMAMNSAMNTTRTGMNDVGNFNQWGENEGGINRGDQVNNMGNTYGAIDTPRFDGWNSEVIKAAMGGPMQFAHGGKVYDLGGSYDLTPEDVANLERLGIRLEKTR